MTTLTIQKVNGLIKRSPVTNVSKKLPSSAKQERLSGLYARKKAGEIVVGYYTSGYKFELNRAQSELNKFIEFAESMGYKLTQDNRIAFQYQIEQNH